MNFKERLIRILAYFLAHEKTGAFIFYLIVISSIYAPVVFFGKSLQSAIYHPFSVTKEGAYNYAGRKPFSAFSVDVTGATYAEFPINKLVGEIYKSGQLPFWNPYKGLGEPLPEQLGSSVFFPYQILEDISPVVMWDYFYLGRLLIAGFFTFLFLRKIKLQKLPSLVGGLLFIFSGSFTWFINNEQMTNAAMMIPILFWSFENLLQIFNFRRILISTLAVVLTLLSGPPGVMVYALALLGLYIAVRLFDFKNETKSKLIRFWLFLKRISVPILVLVLGAALAMPLILPFIDFFGQAFSLRDQAGNLTASPVHLGFIILPGLADLNVNYRYGVNNGLWDNIGSYSGIVPVVLIAIGFFLGKNLREKRKMFYFFSLAGLAILFKNHGILFFDLLGKLPLFSSIWSQRWAGPAWSFSFAIAAALSLGAIAGAKSELTGKISALPGKLKKFRLGLIFIACSAVLIFLSVLSSSMANFIASQKENLDLVANLATVDLAMQVIVTFITLILTFFFAIKSGSNRSYSFALLGLIIVYSWFLIPFGYQAQPLKIMGFFVGLAGLFFIARRRFSTGFFLFLCLLLLFVVGDWYSKYGLPQKYNPFTKPPFVNFLQNQKGYGRTLGTEGILMPNFASSYQVNDFRFISGLISKEWYSFRKNVIQDKEPMFWFLNNPVANVPSERGLIVHETMCGEKFSQAKQKLVFKQKLPFYSLAGIKYILVNKNSVIESEFEIDDKKNFPLVYDGEIKIYENLSVLPRVFIANQVERVSSMVEAQEKLKEMPLGLLSNKVLIEREINLKKENSKLPSESAAEVSSYSPNRVKIDVVSSGEAILVLSDLYYPGWRARVNGQEAEVLRVDGIFRGVKIPSGESEVIFNYRPASFNKGLFLSAVAVLVLISIFIAFKFPKFKQRILIISLGLIAIIIYQQSQAIFDFYKNSKTAQSDFEIIEKNLNLWRKRETEIEYILYPQNFVKFLPSDQRGLDVAINGVVFPKNLSNTFYVDFVTSDFRRRMILMKVIKKGDPEYGYEKELEPLVDYLLDDYFESEEQKNETIVRLPPAVSEVLQKNNILKTFPYFWETSGRVSFWRKERKIEKKLYLIRGLFELTNNRWVLRGGSGDLHLDDAFKYNCDTASWYKELNLTKNR